LSFGVTAASAQTATRGTATVTANAPIYIAAGVSATPLRVAAPGTVLKVLRQQGDWLEVEFNDPQWGLIPAHQRDLPASDPSKIPFQFHVVVDKTPNAFATPNGIVVVHSGLFSRPLTHARPRP
jgi:Zn-dependent protease with chaperone function